MNPGDHTLRMSRGRRMTIGAYEVIVFPDVAITDPVGRTTYLTEGAYEARREGDERALVTPWPDTRPPSEAEIDCAWRDVFW